MKDYILTKICSPMFLVALLKITQMSFRGWMNHGPSIQDDSKRRHPKTTQQKKKKTDLLLCTTARMTLKGIVLSDRARFKSLQIASSYLCHLYDTLEKANYWDGNEIRVCQDWGHWQQRARGNLGGDTAVPYLDCDGGHSRKLYAEKSDLLHATHVS